VSWTRREPRIIEENRSAADGLKVSVDLSGDEPAVVLALEFSEATCKVTVTAAGATLIAQKLIDAANMADTARPNRSGS